LAHINQFVGLVLLALGVAATVVCLIAFLRVSFQAAERKRGAKEILEQINALIRNWTALLKLLPLKFRHIFVLLPVGLVLIFAGLYILIKKPI
jgi:hypothetical protein